MVKYENECCDCAVPGYPCRGSLCPKRNVKHLYCDKCNEDSEKLFILDGFELCEDCLLESFDQITLED